MNARRARRRVLLRYWLGSRVYPTRGGPTSGFARLAIPSGLGSPDRGWRLAGLRASSGGALVRDDLSAFAESASGRPYRRRLLRVTGNWRRGSLGITGGLGNRLACRSRSQRAANEHSANRARK